MKRLHTHRTYDEEQIVLTEKAPISGAFAEPSDGLEPSTPSLPCDASGNRSQPRGKGFRLSRRFPTLRALRVCALSPPGFSEFFPPPPAILDAVAEVSEPLRR